MQGGAAEGASPLTQMVKITFTRPRSMQEFSGMLTRWIMICHATGLANVLALGEFVCDVVHDTMSKLGHSWQIAHELLLVYLEVIETKADSSLNIRSIFASGSQDTYL